MKTSGRRLSGVRGVGVDGDDVDDVADADDGEGGAFGAEALELPAAGAMKEDDSIGDGDGGKLVEDAGGVAGGGGEVARYLAAGVVAFGEDFEVIDDVIDATDGLRGVLGLDDLDAGLHGAAEIDDAVADLDADLAVVDVGLPGELADEIAEDQFVGCVGKLEEWVHGGLSLLATRLGRVGI
jgi:hypothetical protein